MSAAAAIAERNGRGILRSLARAALAERRLELLRRDRADARRAHIQDLVTLGRKYDVKPADKVASHHPEIVGDRVSPVGIMDPVYYEFQHHYHHYIATRVARLVGIGGALYLGAPWLSTVPVV